MKQMKEEEQEQEEELESRNSRQEVKRQWIDSIQR
jgi:hypothetical protein